MTAVSRPICWNMEAEQSLLGAILINNDTYGAAVKYVEPDDFFEPLHREIFKEAGRLITAGRLATPITLKEAFPNLKLGDKPDALTINQYLARLCAEATTIINAPDYARLIRELAMMRQIIAVAEDLQRAPSDGRNADEALRSAFEQLDALRVSGREGGDERASIGRLAERMIAAIDQQASEKSVPVPSTGFTDIDRHIGGGYRAGRLIVVGGRPSMGKTALLGASARRVARRGYGVMIQSMDSDGAEITARMITDEVAQTQRPPLYYRDILAGNLDEGQRASLAYGAAAIAELPIMVDTTEELSAFEIEARARIQIERWRKSNIKPGVLFVDYLQLIKPTERYKGRKVDEIGETTRALRNIGRPWRPQIGGLVELDFVEVFVRKPLQDDVFVRRPAARHLDDLPSRGHRIGDPGVMELEVRAPDRDTETARFRANLLIWLHFQISCSQRELHFTICRFHLSISYIRFTLWPWRMTGRKRRGD